VGHDDPGGVAHRLSTIRDADRIIVMDAGRVVEEGAYEELMARRGLFHELATRQLA
jgi:ATP-binding cassette, subfamily B, bacterial